MYVPQCVSKAKCARMVKTIMTSFMKMQINSIGFHLIEDACLSCPVNALSEDRKASDLLCVLTIGLFNQLRPET